MSDITITFAVLGAAVVLFVWNRVPVGIVALGVALSLYLTGVLDLSQALAGFGDPTVLFIAALFVVSEGLDATGVTAWAGQKLVAVVGAKRGRLLVMTMLLVAALTALISVNGAVAALLPMVVVLAGRLGMSAAHLLMPLAFAAHAGSMLTLTGTPVNVLIAEASEEAGGGGFGFFEFAVVGVPLLVGVIAIAVLLGPRLLPTRSAATISPDLSQHARTLIGQYALRDEVLDLVPDPAGALLSNEHGVVELVIPPRSPLIGTVTFPGMVTESGDLVVLAVQRQGRDRDGRTTLDMGDIVLLQGPWNALDRRSRGTDVLVVDEPHVIRRQALPMGPGARPAVTILAAMVAGLATGIAPAAVVGIVAACAMILLRVLTVEAAYRAVSWTTIVLIAGMIPLSTAIDETGAAGEIAQSMIELLGDSGPYLLLTALFVVTVTLGQLISNTATALILIPVAIHLATETGLSVQPLLMTVAVAAAASFLTPVATPANMMVMEPAGYRFGDYWKFGLPMLLWFYVVAIGVVPLVWAL